MIRIYEADSIRQKDVMDLRKQLGMPALEAELQNSLSAMVFADGDAICGYGLFTKEPPVGVIRELYVLEGNRRNRFGDGLLRAMLNVQERAGCTTAIIVSAETDAPFYRWEDLTLLPASDIDDVPGLPESPCYFQADLHEFFGRPCRGGR